jgi:hypothetical protein
MITMDTTRMPGKIDKNIEMDVNGRVSYGDVYSSEGPDIGMSNMLDKPT